MFDPTDVLSLFRTLSRVPGGRRVFSRTIGLAAPYSGTIPITVLALEPGHARVRMSDRRIVRNHLKSVHAIALMNLGEVTSGLAMYSLLRKGGRGIITGLSMAYVKKARGPITAECTATMPSEPGRHDLQVEAVLRDEGGDEVARLTASWRLDVA